MLSGRDKPCHSLHALACRQYREYNEDLILIDFSVYAILGYVCILYNKYAENYNQFTGIILYQWLALLFYLFYDVAIAIIHTNLHIISDPTLHPSVLFKLFSFWVNNIFSVRNLQYSIYEVKMVEEEVGLLRSVLTNPLNVGLLLICGYLLYKIFKPNANEVSLQVCFVCIVCLVSR